MDKLLASIIGGIPSAVLIGFVANSFLKKFEKLSDMSIQQDKEMALLKKEIEHLKSQK